MYALIYVGEKGRTTGNNRVDLIEANVLCSTNLFARLEGVACQALLHSPDRIGQLKWHGTKHWNDSAYVAIA